MEQILMHVGTTPFSQLKPNVKKTLYRVKDEERFWHMSIQSIFKNAWSSYVIKYLLNVKN